MTDEEIELVRKLLTRLSPLDKGPNGDLMRRYLRWKVKYGTRKEQLRN